MVCNIDNREMRENIDIIEYNLDIPNFIPPESFSDISYVPESFSEEKKILEVEKDSGTTEGFLAHRVVTKKLYDYLYKKYAYLLEKKSHCRMFEYLLFGTFIDNETKRLIISAPILALIEEDSQSLNNKNYSAARFLKEFKAVLPGFEWSKYSVGGPRMVLCTGVDHFDIKMIQENFIEKRIKGTEKVLFRTGEKFSIKKMYQVRKETDERYITINGQLKIHQDQKKVIDYLESLDEQIFSRLINKNIADTLILKDQLVFDPSKPNSKPTQERILDYIVEYPKPHYHADLNSKTMRVSSASDNFLGLKRELRKSLSKGCIEADLASSQFAILAMQYKSKVATKFIKDGKKLWNDLSLFIKNDPVCDDQDKIDMKTALYAMAFGKTVGGTYTGDGKFHPGIVHILQKRKLEKFLQHEVIVDLLVQREKWFKAIKNKGGWSDIYGNFQQVTKERPVRSVAASVIQSIEFKIINGVFDIAKQHGEKLQFKIITFQHDGFLMVVNDKRNQDKIQKLLQEAVTQEAAKWNVITHLDFKQL